MINKDLKIRKVTVKTVFFLFILAAFATFPFITFPQSSDEYQEYQVKAAMLYNFSRFIEWPASALPDASSAFNVCLMGDDPFGSTIDKAFQGRPVKGHEVKIQRLKGGQAAPGQCQIAFISHTEKSRASQIIASFGQSPVLSVSESEQFTKSGGIINFFIDGNKVRFEINLAAAKKAGLQISSKLVVLGRTDSGGM